MSIVNYVSILIDGLGQPQIRSKLLANGFDEIGGGCFKSVLAHKAFPNFVVKVFNSSTAYRRDSTAILPSKLRKYWLKPVYQDKRIQIQDRANGIGGTDKSASDYLKQIAFENYHWHYDLHENNCMFHNGKPVIIDYSSPPKKKAVYKFTFIANGPNKK
jgi:hypothetical protein